MPWNSDAQAPKHNPLGKIPVLILDDGSSVYESSFILEWLETKYPQPPLLPADPDQRLAAKRLEVQADGVCDAFVLYFFERKRPEGQRSQPWIERQLRKIQGGMDEIGRLVPKQGYCVGDRFGLGDIAVGCVVGYLSVRAPEIEWQARHPHLLALYERLMQRESFRTTVPYAQQIEAGVV